MPIEVAKLTKMYSAEARMVGAFASLSERERVAYLIANPNSPLAATAADSPKLAKASLETAGKSAWWTAQSPERKSALREKHGAGATPGTILKRETQESIKKHSGTNGAVVPGSQGTGGVAYKAGGKSPANVKKLHSDMTGLGYRHSDYQGFGDFNHYSRGDHHVAVPKTGRGEIHHMYNPNSE